MTASLSQLGESGLLHLLTGGWSKTNPRVLVGVGDDCAVLRGEGKGNYLLFKTDAVVEGVHFTAETPPELIGRKALARALSDLAAMGARPVAALITLGVTRNESPARLKKIYRGLEKIAAAFAVALIGGETTRAAQLFLNVALLGECRGYAPVLRSTARAGDSVYVTGSLGGTQARHHLTFTPRLKEGEWLARKKIASAMMDLSDGLGADLPRLLEASQLALSLEKIPCSRGASVSAALNDGEDYELLFTVAPNEGARLERTWPFARKPHYLGKLRKRVKKETGFLLEGYGFDHFTERGGNTGLR